MDSQVTPQDESQLDNLEQKDCTSSCKNNDIVITSTNGSIELPSSSNSQPLSDSNLQSCMDVIESDSVNPPSSNSQPLSDSNVQSCMDVIESDSVNLVVTPVLEQPLQNVVSSQDKKDIPSAVINTTVTTVNCHEHNTDSDVLMDSAVWGSGIPESSSSCSVSGSSTCLNSEEIDISHEVQQSDLSTSSDTHKFKCESPKLQLNHVCLQVDEPVNNVINGCGDGEVNSSINDCSISQMSAECLEADKEHSDKLIKCDEVKISSSTDDSKVSQLPSECDQTNQEHSNVVNGNDNAIESSVDDSSVFVEIKQEPHDLEYERSDLIYRSGAIVVDSDDDTSSTMFSNNDAGDSDKDVAIEEEVVEQPKVNVPKSHSKVRTEGEVFPEELPPIEYLAISPDESVILETLGVVSGIVGVLVIVKANPSSPALFDDTVLFLEGRQPLGLIFEVFGTVEQPYYSVRFNTNKDIKDEGIVAGDKVFFAPKADNLTKYVFIAELRKIKCDDASWENDNEPPPSHLEYSDDEKERQARQQQRNKDRGKEETAETCARKKKRRKKPSPGYEKDPHGPQLLQGDLNRNPFGNKNQTFNNSSSKPRWQHSVGNGQSPIHRPRFSPQSAPQPQPTFSGAFRNPWPPQANFAERPGWNQQPGLLGSVPNTAMSGSPNTWNFNGNFSSPQSRQPHPGFGNTPPFPPPGGHNSHGPNPHLPQNSMPPQPNRFQTYFPQGNLGHVNTFSPPPVPQQHRPPGFPMFSPSHPPPVVNTMFNQHTYTPPTHFPPRRLDG